MEDGSGSRYAEKLKTVSKDMSDELCVLMSNIKLKVGTIDSKLAPKAVEVFDDSFATDPGLSNQDLQSMADTWINVEDNPEIMDAIVDDELNDIEEMAKVCDNEDVDKSDDDMTDIDESVACISLKNHTH